MYYYKNTKNVQSKKYSNYNGNKKFPTLLFIILGIISILVAIWLIYSIIQDKKKS